jgi:hypothetical protein
VNDLKVRFFAVLFIAIVLFLAGCSGGTDQPGLDTGADEEIMVPDDSSEDEVPGEGEADDLQGFLTVVYSETGDLWVAIGFNAPRQITSGHFDHYPMLSPDGTKVLFQREVKSGSSGLYRFELWVINTDGSDERRLVSAADLPGQMGHAMGAEEETMLDRLPQQVAWLEDSRRIAFNTMLEVGYGVTSFYDLWIADTETGTVTRLLEDGNGGSFAYSPDGSKIFVSNANVVALVNADGSERRQLVSYPFVNTASEYAYNPQPVWAPDGSFGLVAIASEEPFLADPYITVWRLPLTGEATVISTLPGLNLSSTMDDQLWNAARTALAYTDDEDTLHLATLAGESLYIYGNAEQFYGWSSDDLYWFLNLSDEILLAGTDIEPAPLEMLEGDSLDWFEVKWVSGTEYVVLSGNYYEGMILWTGQVGGSSRVIDALVNSFDALWME